MVVLLRRFIVMGRRKQGIWNWNRWRRRPVVLRVVFRDKRTIWNCWSSANNKIKSIYQSAWEILKQQHKGSRLSKRSGGGGGGGGGGRADCKSREHARKNFPAGTREHKPIFKGNKGTRTPPGRPLSMRTSHHFSAKECDPSYSVST